MWLHHLWQSDLSCDMLPFLSIPRQPVFAAPLQPIFSMHTGLLPGEDPGGVGPRIEELSGLRVPPFPADKAVAERRTTARCRCVVCATLHGICVPPCIFAHPYSPHTAVPLSSRRTHPKAARTRTCRSSCGWSHLVWVEDKLGDNARCAPWHEAAEAEQDVSLVRCAEWPRLEDLLRLG